MEVLQASDTMLPSPRTYSRRHTAVITLAVLVMMAQGVVASTVSGCDNTAEATEANGFFTLFDSTNSGANGCYVLVYGNEPVKCSAACTVGGLECTDKASVTQGTETDCTAALDWYLSSSAKAAGFPSSVDNTGTAEYCSLLSQSGGPWSRNDHAFMMPLNSVAPCNTGVTSGSSVTTVLACKCNDPDPKAPIVQSVVAVQTSASSVAVSGSVDEAASVYCKVGAAGASYTPVEVVAAGFSYDAVAAGSFSVSVTGVSTDGTKSVACVGRDDFRNLGSTTSGAEFEFGMMAALHERAVCNELDTL